MCLNKYVFFTFALLNSQTGILIVTMEAAVTGLDLIINNSEQNDTREVN